MKKALCPLLSLLCSVSLFNSAQAATNVWTKLATGGNASGSWNTAANPPWSLAAIPGAGDTADFSTLNITNSVVTIDANQSINQMLFGDTTTSSAGNWILNNGSGGPNTLTLSGATPTIIVNTLGSGSAVGLDLTLGGTSGFTKSGPGTLTLMPTNSFSGNVVVNGGVLGIRYNDSGGPLNPLGAIPVSFTPDNLTLNGGVLYNLSSGNLIQSMSLTNNRGITIGANGGTFRVNNQAQIMTIWGMVTSTSGGTLNKDNAGTVRFNATLTSVTGKISVTGGLLSYGVNSDILGADFGTFTPDGVTLNGGGLWNSSGSTLVNYSIPANRGVTIGSSGGTFFTDSTSGNVAITVNSVITGAGQLRKIGGGQLTLNSANTYAGGTLITNGPPVNNAGGAVNLADAASLGTGTITFANTNSLVGLRYNGTSGGGLAGNNVVFTSTPGFTNRWIINANLTLSGVLSGGHAASVWAKDGGSDLTISGVNTYQGTTAILDGKLIGVTGGSCSNSALIQLPYNASSGVGVIVNDNTKRWTCASLDCNTAAGVPSLEFTFLTPASTTVAPLNVTGLAAFSATTQVQVNAALLPISTGNGYPLMKWGSMSGTPPTTAELTLAPAGITGTLSVVGNTLYLQITDTSQPLRWAAGNNNWDNFGGLYWMDSALTPTLTAYSDGSAVQFEDTQNAGGGVITMNSFVSPAGVVVNSTNDYVLTGTIDSVIQGATSFTKSGSGTLVIEGPGGNTFTGGLQVNGGTLIAGKPDATLYGTVGNGNLTVNSSALVIVTNDNSLAGTSTSNGKTITINAGATITNTATTTCKLNRLVMNGGTLAATTANSNYGNWALDFGVATLGNANSSSITGGNIALSQGASTTFNILTGDTLTVDSQIDKTSSSADTGLTKTGAGTLILNGNSSSGGTVVLNGGTLTLNGTSSGTNATTLTSGTLRLGNNNALGSGTVGVVNVTIASTDALSRTITNTLSFTTAASVTTYGNGAGMGKLLFTGNANVISGTTGRTFINTADAEFSGNFTGNNGGFLKNGVGTLTISGNATVAWSGGWNIAAGTFLVNGTLTSTNAVTVTNGATLGGTGLINAAIVIGSGSKLAPGASIGTLTVTNSPTWTGGSLVFELNLTNSQTADRLNRTSGGFNFTGATLTVTNIGPALTNGSVFTLFSAGNSGSFVATNVPTLGAGLAWDFSTLASAGTLKVGLGIATNPTNIVWSLSGNQLNLTWPGDHLGWTLQSQTNGINVGLSNTWFDVAGTALATNYSVIVNPANPTVFYRLRY